MLGRRGTIGSPLSLAIFPDASDSPKPQFQSSPSGHPGPEACVLRGAQSLAVSGQSEAALRGLTVGIMCSLRLRRPQSRRVVRQQREGEPWHRRARGALPVFGAHKHVPASLATDAEDVRSLSDSLADNRHELSFQAPGASDFWQAHQTASLIHRAGLRVVDVALCCVGAAG